MSQIETLRRRHADLERQVAEEQRRPRPNSEVLRRLKVAKLRLKDEITRRSTAALATAAE